MTVITILVALVAAAGFSYVFHIIEERRETIENVKSFGEKCNKALQENFEIVKKNFNHLISDLETSQTQANAAVKVLKEKETFFQEKVDRLQVEIDAVNKIDQKITAYDSVLRELDVMTEKVEENLLRLKKEVSVVDTLDNQLGKQKKEVESINARIPQIVKSFNDTNQEQLKLTGTVLLDEYEKYANNVKVELDKQRGEATRLMSQINSDIEVAFDSAAKRADELEGTSFLHLSQQAEKRAAEIKRDFSTLIERLQKEMDALATDTENKINSEVTESLDALERDLNGRIEDMKSGCESEYSQNVDEYKQKFDNFSADVKAYLDKVKASMKEHVDGLSESYQAKYTGLKESYASQLDSLSSKNDGIISKFEEKYQGDLAKINQKTEDYTKTYGKKVDDFIATSDSRLTKVQTDFDARAGNLEHVMEELHSRMSGEENQLAASMENQLKELDSSYQKQLESMKKTLDSRFEKYEEDTQKVSAKVDTYDSSLKEKIENYTGSIQTKLSTYQTTIQDSVKNLQTVSSTSIKETKENIENLRAECKAAISEIKNECSEAEKLADQIKPAVEARIQDVENKIEDFKASSQGRLEALGKTLQDEIRTALSDSESRRLNILESADDQLGEYKRNLEYKIAQLQISSSDVDMLDKSLRNAMSEVQNRILADFDKFTGDQQIKHERFANGIKENAESLESKIQKIEEELQGLKEEATGSMSAKLSDFETEFVRKLSDNGNKVDENLSQWKHDFEGRLSEMAQEYDTACKEVEASYSEKLKSNIQDLQFKSENQLGAVQKDIASTKEKLASDADDLRTKIEQFKADATEKLNTVSLTTQSDIKSLNEKNISQISDAVEKLQTSIQADLENFEAEMKARQETGSSSIDAAVSEFNTWKQQLKTQLSESSNMFRDELETFQHNAEDELEEKEKSVKALVGSYSDSISKEIRETDEKIAELKEKLETVSKNHTQKQNSFMDDMQNKSNNLLMSINEVEKEVSAVQAQVGTYEKADALKKQLDAKIQSIRDAFDDLEKFAVTSEKFQEQYKELCDMNESLGDKVNEFESKQVRVESLEQRFNYMMDLSGQIDSRVRTLSDKSDDLLELESKVKAFQTAVDDSDKKMLRIEEKQKVLDRVNNDITFAFDKQKELEESLADCVRQVNSLPVEIKAVQKDVDIILNNAKKINDTAKKLAGVETILSDTERRIENINSASEGITKLELDIQQLNKEVGDKFDTLRKTTQEKIAKKGGPAKGKGTSPQSIHNVHVLRREGWSMEEIAERTGKTVNEVELILALPDEDEMA